MPRFIPLGFVFLLLAAAGCKQEPAIRQYTEVVPAQAAPPMPVGPGQPPVDLPSAPVSDVTWTAPAGWSEQTGSGMRLATFTLVSGDRKGECTIIVLGEQAGSVADNIKRWVGQLPETEIDEAGLDTYVAGLETFTTAGGDQGTFADLGTFVPDHHDHTSIMAGIIKRGDQNVFVKLMGPKSLLAEQVDPFLQLCKSIR